MDVGVVGMDFRRATLDVREAFLLACRKHFLTGFVLVETCNRTELYFGGKELFLRHIALLERLREEIGMPFEHALYAYFGRDCFVHLIRVTCGLESALIGETEVQGQVKRAYTRSIVEEPLHTLFQKALKIAKEVRTTFTMPKAYKGIEQLIDELAEGPVLLIGNSVVNRRLQCHFQGKREVTLFSRHGKGVWEGLERWTEYPLVVVATRSEGYLIQSGEGGVVVDMCMPRSVHPSVKGVVHLTDLQKHIVQERTQASVDRFIVRSAERSFRLYSQRRAPCAV